MDSGFPHMIEDQALISGIGISDIGRRLGRDPWSLTADACLAAIADAGLSPDRIDGISTYPGASGSTPGISGAGVEDVRALLGLTTRWHTGGSELPGQLGSVINAMLAVSGGLAEHVLCFRTVWESSAQSQLGGRSATMRSGAVRELNQWMDPYGGGYPTFGAMQMQRYMYESGATREQLAQIALVSRSYAELNPQAAYRTPMSMDDYLDARMISDPLCLYDCDVPVDGSIAVVISRADSPDIDRSKALKVQAIGSAAGVQESAEMMWSRTKLTPKDVGVAQLYDGFAILAVQWLEALGFCPKFQGARFIEDGERISLTGDIPLNTGGGQLSGGRMHGYGQLHEACVQLRGEGGARQVASRPGLAVISSGISTFSSCLLLSVGDL